MFAALLVQPASWAPSSLAHSPSSSVVRRARPCVAALEWEETGIKFQPMLDALKVDGASAVSDGEEGESGVTGERGRVRGTANAASGDETDAG